MANGTVTLTALWDDDDLPFSNPPGDGPVLRSGSPTVSDNADFKSYTKSYTYDLAGNRTGFTLTAGETTVQDVAYTYDNLNRLSTVQRDGVTEAAYTYDDNGNRKTLTYANGIVATYTYNKANWVTKITNKKGTTTRSSFDYTYYASGNQKTKTDKSGVVTSYLYDDLGRLTQESETNGVTLAYTYDSSGNRTGLTASGTESYSIAYTYDADNRLLTEVKTAGGVAADSAVYTYDDNGNMLSRVGTASGATVYTYNKLGQQVQAIVNGTKATYTYDTHGIRTSKRVGNTITTFLLDGANVVAEAQNNAVFANYLWGVNPIRADRTNSIRYFLYNAHGDVVQLTNASGSVTKNYSYDAFGNERNYDPAGINPFRYCGEYWDNETRTYYLRARYYDPAIGRFTQMDTHWNVANMIYGDNPQKINERQDALGLKSYTYVPQINAIVQAGNLYVYCMGNPVTYRDPYGMSAVAAEEWITTMWWLTLVDGALPIGDIIYFIGIVFTGAWQFISSFGVDNIARLFADGPNAIESFLDNLKSFCGSSSSMPPIDPNWGDQLSKLWNSFSKYEKHIFSDNHIKDGLLNLGGTKEEIYQKLVVKAAQCTDQWAVGSNEIRTHINGIETTIRFYLDSNGIIRQFNAFVGYSERTIGNLITL